MGLIVFQYIFFVAVAAVLAVGGTIDYLSRGQYLESVALIATIPVAYVITSITPWVRTNQMRKMIATPAIAVALVFAVAFTMNHFGLI